MMQLLRQALQLILLTSTITSVSAASWGFSDATVSIQRKGAGVGNAIQEKYAIGIMANLFTTSIHYQFQNIYLTQKLD